MESKKNEFKMPKRYDISYMERLNKRERELFEKRNALTELFTNRPRLENVFNLENEEEDNINKKEINEILSFLPISKINEDKKPINNNYKCMICLSNYKIRDKIYTLPCLHIFHAQCFEKWMYQKRACPICKFDISLQSLLSSFED